MGHKNSSLQILKIKIPIPQLDCTPAYCYSMCVQLHIPWNTKGDNPKAGVK